MNLMPGIKDDMGGFRDVPEYTNMGRIQNRKHWIKAAIEIRHPTNFITAPKQDDVLADYVRQFDLTSDQAGRLHMFFSPTRILVGLEEHEVRLAINLPRHDNEAVNVGVARQIMHDMVLVLSKPEMNEAVEKWLRKNLESNVSILHEYLELCPA